MANLDEVSEHADEQLPDLRASDADRERVAQQLHNAMADGRITMTELEERLDRTYAARTLGELIPITADLPAETGLPAPRPAVTPSLIGGPPGSSFSVAVMAGANRRGAWVVPAQHTSFAFWGGVDIDLRQATFAQQHTTITAIAIMGGIDIVVPDDIRVEVNGIGFMGGFDSAGHARDDVDPNGPVLTVNGLAFWGGVTVKRRPRRSGGEAAQLPPPL